MIKIFESDDKGYKDWLNKNQNGYLINCLRSPTPNYLFLHKATCHTISGSPAKGDTWTDGDYIKVCSSEKAELEKWAKLNVKGNIHNCEHCRP